MTDPSAPAIDPAGRLNIARWRPSPNADQRPPGSGPDLLVIHNISLPPGHFGGPWIEQLFQNRLDRSAHPYFATLAGLRVSAHLLIRRDGELLQFVELDRRAWHAGRSAFEGRIECNDYSIGIELEGSDAIPFQQAQYTRLAQVTRLIRARYPAITAARITGHQEIAPGRKTDPGPAFDWDRYRALLSDSEGER
ncbi:1,6-anhydro-N-acetylmuramyl-L-alanine amidase AmpD [Halochromatium salexigens]|uniref:1,6-anhydro-N-acetylmuramyl-L-alanine amidase AmpD n=1 Tax=Halochromatium salexigens TaxID=49447 RepID=A0AAJ0UHN1_HALSE|nr:1,6-anhydro-N-acetylmuramyl-L-alanine amidase AmpD [Halochromatium salexigens]MBK5930995.1 N-acetylmuramoyl-L-alanine amidase [Halochromatium salexigens]